MSDKIENVEVDLSGMKAEIKAEMKLEAKAEAVAEQSRVQAIADAAESAVEKAKIEWEADHKAKETAWDGKAPANNTIAGKNSKNSETDEFVNWLRTGDNGAMQTMKVDQKALGEGTDATIGYVVPAEFSAGILNKRDELSWVRQAGVQIAQTERDVFNIPVENTKLTKMILTAEEASYDDNDPTISQVSITVSKWTKLTKMSEELLADANFGLEAWYAGRVAAAISQTEANQVAIGTGSGGNFQGVFVGGTAALTFDSAANITPDEVPELYYKLKSEYKLNSSWLMKAETEAYLRGLRDSSDFSFDTFANQGIQGESRFDRFYGGRPIHHDTNVAAIATGNKVMLIGDFSYYMIAERPGLSISRNPFLYQATGQVGFFSNVRMGGAVLQAEAFQIGKMA